MRTQRAGIPPGRTVGFGVENQVVLLSIIGEVLPFIVDDVVEADGSHHVELGSAINSGRLGPVQFGDLDTQGADTSTRSVDQQLLPLLNLPAVDEALHRQHRGMREGCRLLESHLGGFARQRILVHTNVLRKAAKTGFGNVSVHVVARLKPLDVLAHCFDAPCHFGSEDLDPRFENAKDYAQCERPAPHELPIPVVDGRCVNLQQDLVVLWIGFFDLFELKDVGRSKSREYHRFHGFDGTLTGTQANPW